MERKRINKSKRDIDENDLFNLIKKDEKIYKYIKRQKYKKTNFY